MLPPINKNIAIMSSIVRGQCYHLKKLLLQCLASKNMMNQCRSKFSYLNVILNSFTITRTNKNFLFYSYTISRNFQNNVINALASCTLRDTNVSPASFDAIEKHPLTIFVKGASQTREDLLSHPEIESLLFISKNQLVEMFFPRIIKEFDDLGNCTTKISGIIGKTVENASIISLQTNDIFADFLTFWSDGIVPPHFQKGTTIPQEKFRKEASTTNVSDAEKSKPWIPAPHPASIVRVPLCIPKLKGIEITTGPTYKTTVRESLLKYSRSAADWYDSITAFRLTTKLASHKDFDKTFHPSEVDTKFLKEKSSLQPVFEFDTDSLVHTTMTKIISSLKEQCLKNISPPSVEPSDEGFMTPPKQAQTFCSPKPPRSVHGEESVLTETVKEKVKFSVFFYRLLLSANYDDNITNKKEIILGNLSDSFLTSLNTSGRSESQRIFTNAFTTYKKERLQSDSFLDTAINFPHINRTMVSLLLTGDFRSSPLDEDTEYITQSLSVLSFLPPPKLGENSDYKMYVQRSKETSMEDVVEERPEKCSAYDKKVFTKGRQDTYQDAIATIANLTVFFEFIFDETQSSETPALILMLKGLGKVLVNPSFRRFAEKNEHTIPWLTHTLVCQVQSVLNRFVDIATNFTYQRLVDNGSPLPCDVLDPPFKTYKRILNNLDDTLNNSSNILFGVKPLSFVDRSQKRKSNGASPPTVDGKNKRQNVGTGKGWLTCSGGSFSFPSNLSRLPCKSFALEGLECSYGRTCKFEHKAFPKGFRKIDQAIICKWVKEQNNVSFSSSVSEKDRNIKHSPFGPSTPRSETDTSGRSSNQDNGNPREQGTTDNNTPAPPASNNNTDTPAPAAN